MSEKKIEENNAKEEQAQDRAMQEQSTQEEKKKTEEPTNIVKEILSFVGYLAVVVVLTFLIITYIGQRTQVSGNSMNPMLSNGDSLIVDKISYRFHDPERFDIIIFPYEYQEKTYFIKRIIGLPGETVQIEADGTILIDGEPLDESYGLETIEEDNRGMAEEPIHLGDDEYFVMGDNRNNSEDSRFYDVGNIKRERIVGRAWVRIWPFSSFGILKK